MKKLQINFRWMKSLILSIAISQFFCSFLMAKEDLDYDVGLSNLKHVVIDVKGGKIFDKLGFSDTVKQYVYVKIKNSCPSLNVYESIDNVPSSISSSVFNKSDLLVHVDINEFANYNYFGQISLQVLRYEFVEKPLPLKSQKFHYFC